jgi:hypothetical protein
MPRHLWIVAALLAAQSARAETTLTVFSPDQARAFDLSLVDQAGNATKCTLPTAGGCHLSLSPGELRLNVQSNGETLTQPVTIREGSSALKLEYGPTDRGYIGVGYLGGGVVFAILSGVAFAQYHGTPTPPAVTNYAPVTLGAVSAIVAAGLFVAGAYFVVSDGFGPHVQANFVAANEAPKASPVAAPAPDTTSAATDAPPKADDTASPPSSPAPAPDSAAPPAPNDAARAPAKDEAPPPAPTP